MTTTADLARQDRLARDYGVQESGMPVGHEYHSQVQDELTLGEVAARKGRVTRVRVLTERVFGSYLFDTSYVHATLPDGTIVRVRVEVENLIPRNRYKGALIDWAKREGVYAKGIGLLDEGNWSILWA